MIRVCPLSALPPGEAIRVDAEPPIAVFHTEEGEVFAIDDTCTHQDASLAEGWVEGCEVECPPHASKFDLRTGHVDAPPAKWLAGSGVTLGNGVECDHQGRISLPGVVAVGDCANWHDVRRGCSHRIADADSVSVEEGSVEGRDVLAVYRRGEEPVAVLGMNQSRHFGRWRRQLNAAPVPA